MKNIEYLTIAELEKFLEAGSIYYESLLQGGIINSRSVRGT